MWTILAIALIIVSFWIPAKIGALIAGIILIPVGYNFFRNVVRGKWEWSTFFTILGMIAFIWYMLS